jgi:hypothetical protein
VPPGIGCQCQGEASRHPELGDGYEAALVNFGYMDNAVITTNEAVKAMT